MFERLFMLTELTQHHRKIPVSLRKIGPQLEGTPEVLDRITGPARSLDCQSECAQGLRIVRIELAAQCDSSRSLVSTGPDF